MAKRKKTVTEPPPVQKPQGKGGKKRTPTSSFDPAAGQDIYEPERILAERLKSGVTQFELSTRTSSTYDTPKNPVFFNTTLIYLMYCACFLDDYIVWSLQEAPGLR